MRVPDRGLPCLMEVRIIHSCSNPCACYNSSMSPPWDLIIDMPAGDRALDVQKSYGVELKMANQYRGSRVGRVSIYPRSKPAKVPAMTVLIEEAHYDTSSRNFMIFVKAARRRCASVRRHLFCLGTRSYLGLYQLSPRHSSIIFRVL